MRKQRLPLVIRIKITFSLKIVSHDIFLKIVLKTQRPVQAVKKQ